MWRVNILIIFFFLLFLSLPQNVLATDSVIINEIMYDLEGSDTDREWIELKNVTSQDIDLTNWRFEEGGTQHILSQVNGSLVLKKGQFAVLVDNNDKFKQDNTNFTGTIIDSSFSLSNTQETLILRNGKDGEIIFEITYSSDQGAKGDGNSLQRTATGNFIPAIPSPGKTNNSQPMPSPEPSQEVDEITTKEVLGDLSSKAPVAKISTKPQASPKSTITKVKVNPPILSESEAKKEEKTVDLEATSTAKFIKANVAKLIFGSAIILIGLALLLYYFDKRNSKLGIFNEKE